MEMKTVKNTARFWFRPIPFAVLLNFMLNLLVKYLMIGSVRFPIVQRPSNVSNTMSLAWSSTRLQLRLLLLRVNDRNVLRPNKLRNSRSEMWFPSKIRLVLWKWWRTLLSISEILQLVRFKVFTDIPLKKSLVMLLKLLNEASNSNKFSKVDSASKGNFWSVMFLSFNDRNDSSSPLKSCMLNFMMFPLISSFSSLFKLSKVSLNISFKWL